ncbi:hypothetical protein MMC28_006430 [Mycoblastus sanguinarius]|nr:hypothetical protein [Mycoblastus sanguinarius]
MTVFASRILLFPVIATRLAFINKAKDSHGHFVDNFNIAVVTVAHINLNTIVTCFPFIKPITDSLQTGILMSDLHKGTRARLSTYPIKHFGTKAKERAPKGRSLFTSESSGMPIERIPSGHSEERMINRQDLCVDIG